MGTNDPLPQSENGDSENETRLDELVARYLDRLNSGEPLNPLQILADHPDLGGEILKDLQTYFTLESEEIQTAPLGIIGDYTLHRQIGRGGMGVVYEAWENSMDRQVALKVLPVGVAADEKALHRFVREAKTAGRLHHSNVVSVYGMGLKEQTPYYAMEFVEGETLAQILARLRAAEEKDEEKTEGTEKKTLFDAQEIDLGYFVAVAKAFAGVADGLQHAHSKGVIHRDIKPSNLILDEEGRLRILDFGLARLEGQESLTLSGDFLGTVLYMSPEQAMAKRIPIDYRTDIYSLGATMYEMLARRPVFEGKSREHTLSQIITRDPVSLRRRDSRIPKDLETIIFKCLYKAPDDRYGSAEALAQDLRRFACGAPIEARPQPAFERVARRAWRHRIRVAAIGFAALFLMASGTLFYEYWSQAYEARLELYRNSVLEAVMKMEFGESLGKGHHRLAPAGQLETAAGGVGLEESGVAYAAAAQGRDVLPNPIEEARKELERAAALFPDQPEAHYHLARALLFLGKEDDAKKRRQLADQVAERGWAEAAEMWLQAYRHEQVAKWKEAIDAYTQLIREQEAVGSGRYLGFAISARLGRGRVLIQEEDLDGALEDFSAAHALWPDLATPVLLSGKTYFLKGNLEKAERRFEGLLLTASDPDEVILQVSRTYYDLHEYEKALAWADRAQESPEREHLRARSLKQLLRYDESFDAAKRGVELAPRHARLHDALAGALAYHGKFDEALLEHSKAVELDPEDSWVHNGFGHTLYLQGKLEEAKEEFKKAIELDPKNAAPYVNMGIIYYLQKNSDEAINWFRKTLEINPRNAPAYNNMANIIKRQGKRDEAIGMYRKSILLNPLRPGVYRNLGMILLDQGNKDEALAAYRQVIEIHPSAQMRWTKDIYNRITTTLLSNKYSEFGGEFESLLETLNKIQQSEEDPHPGVFKALAASYILDSPLRNPEKAFEQAHLFVKEVGQNKAEAIAFLGEIQFRAGHLEDAVQRLEEVAVLPDATSVHNQKLEAYRKALLPDLISFASIDAELKKTPTKLLIPEGAEWRFFRGTREPSPGLEWAHLEFDDSSWGVGPSGFGYGDNDDATILDDMRGAYTTLYIRHVFEVPDSGAFKRLILSMWFDDGFVAYLNGKEVGRGYAGESNTVVPFDGTATEGRVEVRAADLKISKELLQPGENVLAIQGLNCNKTSSDFSLIPELRDDIYQDEILRRVRVLRALEVIGSPKARAVVEMLVREGPCLPGMPDTQEVLERFSGVAKTVGTTSNLAETAQAPANVYGNDFEDFVGSEWSSTKTDSTPEDERRFLGQFGNDRVTLTLDNLPAHECLQLSFELFLIRTWDGNIVTPGPDMWDLSVEGGPILLHTTFRVFDKQNYQAYPDDYPIGDHSPFEGASERNSLGYTFGEPPSPYDAVYQLSFTFPHSSPRVEFCFSASGLQALGDESWGLDNVVVETLPACIPLSPEEEEHLWADLAAEDPIQANEALWALVAAGNGGVAYLRERFEETKELRDQQRQEFLVFDSRRFDAFRQVAAGEDRIHYLEGRLLQRAGKFREAVETFERLLALDNTEPEPFIQVAECLCALGDAATAEERLRQAIHGRLRHSRDLWDLWFALSAVELKRNAGEILAFMPPALEGESNSPEADLRWLLESLLKDGDVRINCGGNAYKSEDGTEWRQDCLMVSGRYAGTVSRPVLNTKADELYKTERWFHPDQLKPPGYRIPLPPGVYKITLGFAEVHLRETGKRRFTVRLEGETVLEQYEPEIDRAEDFTFEKSVEDGHLDIEFVHELQNPKISAIAIEPVP